MYARVVTMMLKTGDAAGLTKAMEDQVIPLLKKQAGFKDELALISTDRKQAVGISLWERKEDADAYNRSAFPEVMKALENFLVGRPEVLTCEVTNSTFHKIAARAVGM